MKKTITLIAAMAALAAFGQSQKFQRFGDSFYENRKLGAFSLEWRLCTNFPPSNVGLPKDAATANGVTRTNTIIYGQYFITNGFWYPPCDKQHVDLSEHTDTTVVTSNLFAIVTWRNGRVEHCLEMVPYTNIVRRWKNVVEKRYIDEPPVLWATNVTIRGYTFER